METVITCWCAICRRRRRPMIMTCAQSSEDISVLNSFLLAMQPWNLGNPTNINGPRTQKCPMSYFQSEGPHVRSFSAGEKCTHLMKWFTIYTFVRWYAASYSSILHSPVQLQSSVHGRSALLHWHLADKHPFCICNVSICSLLSKLPLSLPSEEIICHW